MAATSTNLHGCNFYDAGAEVGMQKGTLHRTSAGQYIADVGVGPEEDQQYSQAEALQVVQAWREQHAKDCLQRLARDRLRAEPSTRFRTANDLLGTMLPARQNYVDQCGGLEVALSVLQDCMDDLGVQERVGPRKQRYSAKRKGKSNRKPSWGKLLKRGQRGPRDCWKRGSQIALHLLGNTLPLSQIPLPLDCPFGLAQQFFKQQHHPLQPLKADAGPRYLLSQPDGVYLSRLSLRYGLPRDFIDEYHVCVYYVNGITRQLRDGGLRGTVYAVTPEDCISKRKAQRALREFIGGQVSSVRPLEVHHVC